MPDQGRQVGRRYLELLHSDIGWTNRVEVHGEILAAVEAQDSLLVEELTARHIREGHDPIFRYLSKIALEDAKPGDDGKLAADLSLTGRIWSRSNQPGAGPLELPIPPVHHSNGEDPTSQI